MVGTEGMTLPHKWATIDSKEFQAKVVQSNDLLFAMMEDFI